MTQITVATLNLHNRYRRWRERRHLVVGQIMDAAPDLLSLQEINLMSGQGRWLMNQINSRLGSTSGQQYRLLQCRHRGILRGLIEGVGILTRLPVVVQDDLDLEYDGRVALRVNVALSSGQTLDFVATHLLSASHSREARLEQALLLTSWLRGTGSSPLQVVAGDFNETPDGPAVRHMKEWYRSAFAECHGYEPLATYPTVLLEEQDGWSGCLDYVFISSGISVVESRLFCNRSGPNDPSLYPSDHVGVLATLEVAPPAKLRQTGKRMSAV